MPERDNQENFDRTENASIKNPPTDESAGGSLHLKVSNRNCRRSYVVVSQRDTERPITFLRIHPDLWDGVYKSI